MDVDKTCLSLGHHLSHVPSLNMTLSMHRLISMGRRLLCSGLFGWPLLCHAWPTPAYTSPADGADVWVGVTFDWAAVTNSQFYQMQADTTPTFDSGALRSVTHAYINSSSGNSDTRANFNDLFFGRTYHWRVRAWVTGDTSDWSVPRTVNTRDFVPPTSPANGADTWTGVTLDWGVHVGVSFYDLQLDTTSGFDSPVLFEVSNAYINNTDGNADTRHFATNLYFGRQYFWRVRARNPVDSCSWSEARSINTRDFVPLTSPADGAETWTGVTLDWGVHVGVAFYDMQLDTTPGFDSPVLFEVSNAYINSTDGNADTRHFATNLYFGRQHFWRVRARNAVDTCSWSPVRAIDTRDFVPMTSPADGAETWVGVTLDWGVHVGVSFYDMEVDTSLAFDSPMLQQVSNAYINSTDGNGDTRHFATNLFFGQPHFWRVRARNAVDTCSWSPVRTIHTRDFVNLTGPANGLLNANTNGVTLNWAPHPGVSVYQLQWDTTNIYDSGLLNTVNKNYINSTDGNSDTQHASGALLSDQVYFWRVRAWNGVDTSAWTERVFTTGTALLLPQVPALVSPADGAQVQTATVPLVWAAATNASGYTVQISEDPAFTQITSFTVEGTTVESPMLEVGSTYHWRVRSVAGGIVSDWSVVWSFARDFSTGVGHFEAGSVLHVYPNPASNRLTVLLPEGAVGTGQVVDLMGRVRWEARLNTASERMDLDVAAWPTGTYLLRLRAGDRIHQVPFLIVR